MHDRLRVHHHLELGRYDREQVEGLDQLQPLVHQGGRVDGDLAPHRPVGVAQRLLGRGAGQLLQAPGAKRPTGGRQHDALDGCGVGPGNRLEDGGVLGIDRHQLGAASGAPPA